MAKVIVFGFTVLNMLCICVCMYYYCFLKNNFPTIFQSIYPCDIPLAVYFCFFPHFLTFDVVSIFKILAILIDVKWYLILVLIYIFILFLVMCFLMSFVHFLRLLFVYFRFCCWVVVLLFSFLYSLDPCLLWDMWFANIFFQYIVCLFIHLTEPFIGQVQFTNGSFYVLWFWSQVSQRTPLPNPGSQRFSLIFSLNVL